MNEIQHITTMLNRYQVCAKIRELFDDLGECGRNVDVDYDLQQHLWTVDLDRGGQRLRTYIDHEDVVACMFDDRCFDLGVEVAQLRYNHRQLLAG